MPPLIRSSINGASLLLASLLAWACSQDCDCPPPDDRDYLPELWTLENASSRDFTVVWCDSCGQVLSMVRRGEVCSSEVYGSVMYLESVSGEVYRYLAWGSNQPDMLLEVGEEAIVLCKGRSFAGEQQEYVSRWMSQHWQLSYDSGRRGRHWEITDEALATMADEAEAANIKAEDVPFYNPNHVKRP